MRIRSIKPRPGSPDTCGSDGGHGSLPSPRPTLSEAEAALYIGMSRAWLKKSRTRRFRDVVDAPPFIRAGGRRVVYRRQDLDAWQERHLEQVGPTRTAHQATLDDSEHKVEQ